jgi:predicted dehydrogenase
MRTCIYGTKGTIICDNTSPTMQLFVVDENGVAPEEPQIIELEVNNHNFVKEFEVFGDAIVNGTDVPTPVEEGAKTVAACLAIVESANTGKIVKPDYNF